MVRIIDVMTREVATTGPEATLKQVAGILRARGISGLPVVDDEGHVLGVVSETDLVAKESEPGRAVWTASEGMTSPPLTVDSGRRVYEAARLMTEHSVNRLPVLNDGVLVGIVTRADLVRAFTRSDEDIRSEIRDDVLLHVLWIPPERVGVTVSAGQVTLSGELDSQADAELLVRFVERVVGVVAVDSHLTWMPDHDRAGSEHRGLLGRRKPAGR